MVAGEKASSDRQGAWTKYKDLYPTPLSFLKDQIKSTRSIRSESMQKNLPAETIVTEHVMGEPYPADIELIYLFVNDFVGEQEHCPITESELLNNIIDLYSAEDWGAVKPLTENNFEALRERIQKNRAMLDAEVEVGRKKNLAIMLDAWNPLRVDEFIKLKGSNEQNEAIRSIYAGLIEQSQLKQYIELSPTIDQYLLQISEIFQLTPNEIWEISYTEAREGYLYLDTLASAYTQLTPSYKEAMRVELETYQFGSSHTDNTIVDIYARPKILRSFLRYGAGSSSAVRDSSEVLFKVGKEMPDIPPTEVNDPN
jgi:hypothetical protein